jgi:hypothetical protein
MEYDLQQIRVHPWRVSEGMDTSEEKITLVKNLLLLFSFRKPFYFVSCLGGAGKKRGHFLMNNDQKNFCRVAVRLQKKTGPQGLRTRLTPKYGGFLG